MEFEPPRQLTKLKPVSFQQDIVEELAEEISAEQELLRLAEEELDPELRRIAAGEGTIDDFLKRGSQETPSFFNLRREITLKLNQANLGLQLRSVVYLGYLLTQKVYNGVTYNQKIEDLISAILNQPS